MRGKGGPENASCNYKGVRQRTWGKWVAEICEPNRGERIWLGSFEDSKSAALAYDKAAIRIFGPTAKLNFPNKLPQVTFPVHATAATSEDTKVDQRRYTDMLNFYDKLLQMFLQAHVTGDEVSLISNPYACLINDYVYDYNDQFILQERLHPVAPPVYHGEFQGSDVKNDISQTEKRDNIKGNMRVELPDYDDYSLGEIKDPGVVIAGKTEDVEIDDKGEYLGSIKFWF